MVSPCRQSLSDAPERPVCNQCSQFVAARNSGCTGIHLRVTAAGQKPA
ncbi:hypothetical protein SL1157_2346 [Ruegeria lacuscaerulensis ITI-1157]|nr:hypothetical protein SL1157_2346 [Ruegeria lacuscaerulensis ITI-1157]